MNARQAIQGMQPFSRISAAARTEVLREAGLLSPASDSAMTRMDAFNVRPEITMLDAVETAEHLFSLAMGGLDALTMDMGLEPNYRDACTSLLYLMQLASGVLAVVGTGIRGRRDDDSEGSPQ